ncbi:hypothetical protein V2W45_1334314 [Cenococcum geophilum]
MLYERETERLSKYFSEDELLKEHAENNLKRSLSKRQVVRLAIHEVRCMQYCHWSHKLERKAGVVPDYGPSPAIVFIDVAEKLLATVGTEILCRVQNSSELPGLPQTGVLLVEPTPWGLEGRLGLPYPSELAECTPRVKP